MSAHSLSTAVNAAMSNATLLVKMSSLLESIKQVKNEIGVIQDGLQKALTLKSTLERKMDVLQEMLDEEEAQEALIKVISSPH